MIVVIPTIGGSDLLPAMLDVLLDDPSVREIHLVENDMKLNGMRMACQNPRANEELEGGGEKLYHHVALGRSIYWSWNWGMDRGTMLGRNTALLNDDLVLQPNSVGALNSALNYNPQYTLIGMNYFEPEREVDFMAPVRPVRGTYRTTGFGGFAFAVAPHCPHVAEEYRWWYGDDDLAERIKAQGGQLGLATGAPVAHPFPSSTGNQQTWLGDAIEKDTILFRSLWPNAE